MFSVGEYVIYGYEGVCKVEEVGHPALSGLDRKREYYRLTPYYRGGTIYAPVDGRIAMVTKDGSKLAVRRETLEELTENDL